MIYQTCSGNGIFDPISSQCKAIENVPSCGLTSNLFKNKKTPTVITTPIDFVCLDDGFYADPSIFSLFYSIQPS